MRENIISSPEQQNNRSVLGRRPISERLDSYEFLF